jgi:hypothetical protein
MPVATVRASIDANDQSFAYHVGYLNDDIVDNGLTAGGLSRGGPVDDAGFGDVAYVFRTADLPEGVAYVPEVRLEKMQRRTSPRMYRYSGLRPRLLLQRSCGRMLTMLCNRSGRRQSGFGNLPI